MTLLFFSYIRLYENQPKQKYLNVAWRNSLGFNNQACFKLFPSKLYALQVLPAGYAYWLWYL